MGMENMEGLSMMAMLQEFLGSTGMDLAVVLVIRYICFINHLINVLII